MTGTNHENRRMPVFSGGGRRKLFRVATLLVAVVLAWLAFRPSTGMDAGLPWDKANHAASFVVLTVLTGCGWPGVGAGRMALIMLAAGTGIELVQGLPAVGRDADVWDVVADMAGAATGWAALTIGGLRRRLGGPGT